MMFERLRKQIAFWIYPPEVEDVSEHIRRNNEKHKLYSRIYELETELKHIDKVAIMRKELGGIDMDAHSNYLAALSVEEIKAFNQWGFELYHSVWWKYLVSWLINNQSATALGNILVDDRRALFGAGRVDGLMALRDEVESRKDSFVTDNPDAEEQYDENRIIQG